MTAQDIINVAAKNIGVLASGETLASEEYTDCLEKLNSLITSWDVERLNIYAIQTASYALTANRVTPYTIGAGAADFNTGRPISIRLATHVINAAGLNSIRHLIRLVEAEEYGRLAEQANTANVPEILYYDNNYPIASLFLHPWTNVASFLELETWEPIGTWPLLTTPFDLPPAYQLAVEWNLSVQIADMFGRTVSQTVMKNAMDSKNSLRMLNLPPAPGVAQEGGARMQASQALAPPATPDSVKQ